MAWCCQATSHYLNQCWLRSMFPLATVINSWCKRGLKPSILCHLSICLFQKDFHRPISTATKPPVSKPSGPKTIEQLRAERLAREKAERARTEQLLAKMRGEKDPSEAPEPVEDDRHRRYNSQFNPEFVRKPKRKRDHYEWIMKLFMYTHIDWLNYCGLVMSYGGINLRQYWHR